MKKKVRRVSELASSRQERRKEFYQRVSEETLNLREAVTQYRYMIGKTQKEFASFVGVPLRTLREFEQGHGNPTIQTMEKMLKGSGLQLTVKRER